jgi:nucleoside phosphorylase
VMAKLEQNLLHLESSGECLDQDSAADGSKGNPEVVLGKVEDIVPQASFTVVLHLREVEVRTATASEELFGIVEEVEGKVEDGAAQGLIVNGHTRFIEMPSSRAM